MMREKKIIEGTKEDAYIHGEGRRQDVKFKASILLCSAVRVQEIILVEVHPKVDNLPPNLQADGRGVVSGQHSKER